MVGRRQLAAMALPRLHMKDELLRAMPEVARLLGLEVPPPPASADSGENGPGQDVPSVIRSVVGSTARREMLQFGEELSEEEQLRIEMEAVKRERAQLLAQLAQAKAEGGKAGGDAQQEDIRRLRRDLSLKKDKLNDIRRERYRLERQVERLAVTSRDCSALMPTGAVEIKQKMEEVKEAIKNLDFDIVEAEAKHRLYTLLAQRTAREHAATAEKVKEARVQYEAYCTDCTSLLAALREGGASVEDAEREVAHQRHLTEQARLDWLRKLKDRRQEVRDLEKRQQKEATKEEKRRAGEAEKERIERERLARLRVEEEAYEQQLQALVPKLENLESQWALLHNITGADTPEGVFAYFQGLKAKEDNMRQLVKLAESREGAAKTRLAAALDARSGMLEVDAPSDDVAAAEAAAVANRLDDAKRREAAARAHLGKLQAVFIAAQQGLRAMGSRIEAVLNDVDRRPTPQAPLGDPGGRPLRRTSSRGTLRRTTSGGLSSNTWRRGAGKLLRTSSGSRQGSSQIDRDLIPTIESIQEDEQGEGSQRPAEQDAFPGLINLLQEVSGRLNRLRQLTEPSQAWSPSEVKSRTAPGPPGEADLMRGMRTCPWAGPAWLASVTERGHILPAKASIKRKKGKKKMEGPVPDLTHIYGYVSSDADVKSLSSRSSDDWGFKEIGSEEWDGVIDRDYVKHRSQKVVAKRENANKSRPATASGKKQHS